MLNSSDPYYRQVELLLALMPLVKRETCFALKGGSAINLFIRNLPRLSVDLDLTYLPVIDRGQSLKEMNLALKRIAQAAAKSLPDVFVQQMGGGADSCTRIFVSRHGEKVKIETSPVLRGAVSKPGIRGVCASIEDRFGFLDMVLLHPNDIFGGKLCAALDRQHPRDLFDVKLLLEEEGIGDELLQVFMVYLISGNRPLSEMLAPQFQPLDTVFETQFKGMFLQPTRVEDLEETRRILVKLIQERLSDDQRRFLLSFKQGAPDWSLFPLAGVANLPAVQWKLINIKRMTKSKHVKAVEKLKKVLFG